jgi:ABC-type multidrug transport system fused ATPase/permease subunit
VASAAFTREFERRDQSVLATIVGMYSGAILLTSLTTALTAACAVLTPVVLHHVVDALGTPRVDLEDDLGVWLGFFFAAKLFSALLGVHSGFDLEIVAGRLEGSLRAKLLGKALRLSARGKKSKGEGETKEQQQGPETAAVDLANLFSTDVNNVLYAAFNLNNLWILPLQIGVVVYLLCWVWRPWPGSASLSSPCC